jgi:hypothetical protein
LNKCLQVQQLHHSHHKFNPSHYGWKYQVHCLMQEVLQCLGASKARTTSCTHCWTTWWSATSERSRAQVGQDARLPIFLLANWAPTHDTTGLAPASLACAAITIYSCVCKCAVAYLVEALYYKPEYRGFDPDKVIGLLPVALWPWGRLNL